MQNNAEKYEAVCIAALFLLASLIILKVYLASGVGWDFLSHYLNGRTLANGQFYSYLAGLAHAGNKSMPALIVSKGIYFDQVWEPLPSAIIALFIIALRQYALAAYLVFLVGFLFFSSYIAARKIGINPLILSSIMAAPFCIRYEVLYNGAEVLALALFLIALGYAAKRESKAGLFVGLMGLAKYESLAIAPLLFLIGKARGKIKGDIEVAKAIALALLVTAPWLIFNFVYFRDPLQSYIVQMAEIQPQHNILPSFISAIIAILWYPAVLMLVAFALRIYAVRKTGQNPYMIWHISKWQYRMQIAVAAWLLAFAGFAFSFANAQGAIRLGYEVYGASGVIAAISLEPTLKNIKIRKGFNAGRVIPYLIFAITIAMIFNMYCNLSAINFNMLQGLGFKYQGYSNAANALKSHNLSNCEVVSNAWPYLNFYNITAFSTYACNSTIEKMPVVIFWNEGVQDYCGNSIESINMPIVFNYKNFSIYLPKNYTCVK